jgi:hypothetical protein
VTEPRDSYSPERRTALIFTGSGADGAYHAGAMRAIQEAGVKVDVVAGRGIGALAAVRSSGTTTASGDRRPSRRSIAGAGRSRSCAGWVSRWSPCSPFPPR